MLDFPEFGEAEDLPPPERRGGKGVGPRKLGKVAKTATPLLLDGQPFSMDLAVAAVGDKNSNNLSTLLGVGIGGANDGPRLQIIDRAIAPCQYNVAKLIKLLSDSEQRELISKVGGKEEFRRKFCELPKQM